MNISSQTSLRLKEIAANLSLENYNADSILQRTAREADRLSFLQQYLRGTKSFCEFSWNERVQLNQQFEIVVGHGEKTEFTKRHEDEREFYNAIYSERELDEEAIKAIRPDEIPVTNCGLEPYVEEIILRMQPLKGKKILEVGGGGGIFGLWMALQGAEVTILDVSDKALDFAKRREAEIRKRYPDRFMPPVRYVGAPAEQLDFEFPELYFDFVFAYAVVHHLETESFAYAIDKVLKREGTVILCYEPLFFSKTLHRLRRSKLVTRFLPHGSETKFERRLDYRDMAYYKKHFTVEALPSNFIFYNMVSRIFLMSRKPWFWALFKIIIWPQKETKWSYDQFGDVSSRCLAREYEVLRKYPILKYLCGNASLIMKKK